MSDQTTIEWTDATFNPWWGCTRVSPGCDHCYAEGVAKRYSPDVALWDTKARRTFGVKHWTQPLVWNARAAKAGKRMRVFCASMADVFDKDAPEGERERLWTLIEATPSLDWQVLTKRIGNVARMVPERWMRGDFIPWLWLGISVVNQEEADRDIPKLLALPARIRWLSCEPLLGPIDLRSHLEGHCTLHDFAGGFCIQRDHPEVQRLGWVVAGGESGPKARPMHPDWARSIRNQCAAAGVPFLFKQNGEYVSVSEIEGPGEHFHFPDGATVRRVGKKLAGRTLDGRMYDGYPA